MIRKWQFWALVVVGVLALIQLIRPSTSNPPVDPSREIARHLIVDVSVQSIFDRSCNDCHSNRTVWPWYSRVAPISWLVASDVNDGRRHVNFSEWGTYTPKESSKILDQICQDVQEGDMPPFQYRPMHPGSALTQDNRQQICQWAANTKQGLSADAVVAQ